jgi:hypothetical protein
MCVIEQTIEIPADGWVHFDVPPEYSAGTSAKVLITAASRSVYIPESSFKGDDVPEEAKKIWAWNRSHREEVRAKLQKLHGSLPQSSFGGLDGVSYQRKVRDEWDAN